jgi:hypothetical protein
MMATMPSAAALWTWPWRGESSDSLGAAGPGYAGYKVIANDGEIGRVDSSAHDANRGHIIVDTGGWLTGRKSVIPARAVRNVNDRSRTIQVDLTREQIRDAPEYDEGAGYDGYREDGTTYYGQVFERDVR